MFQSSSPDSYADTIAGVCIQQFKIAAPLADIFPCLNMALVSSAM